MGYFDDIEFIDGSAISSYKCELTRDRQSGYTLEFIGAGRMRCQIDGQARTALSAPCVFWHHPAHRYSYGPCDAKGWDQHWILMRGERPRRMLEECLLPEFPSGFAQVANPELFDEEFHSLLELAFAPDKFLHAEAATLLERMVAQLFCASRKPASGDIRFKELFETLRLNPAKAWDFQKIAEREGMSYGHFRRRFRELSGRSPHEFALLCRMRRAALRLRDSNLQVKSIAMEAGYPDPAQFSKMFKQFMGFSPLAYRNALPRG